MDKIVNVVCIYVYFRVTVCYMAVFLVVRSFEMAALSRRWTIMEMRWFHWVRTRVDVSADDLACILGMEFCKLHFTQQGLNTLFIVLSSQNIESKKTNSLRSISCTHRRGENIMKYQKTDALAGSSLPFFGRRIRRCHRSWCYLLLFPEKTH